MNIFTDLLNQAGAFFQMSDAKKKAQESQDALRGVQARQREAGMHVAPASLTAPLPSTAESSKYARQDLNVDNLQNPFPEFKPVETTIPVLRQVEQVARLAGNVGVGAANTIVGKGMLAPAFDTANQMAASKLRNEYVPYQDLISSQGRLGRNIVGENATPQEILGNVAGTLNPILTAYTGGKTGSTVASGMQQSLGSAIRDGVISGGLSGFGYGALGGLEEGRIAKNFTDQLRTAAQGGISGAVGGAVLGGALSGIGNVWNKQGRPAGMSIKAVEGAQDNIPSYGNDVVQGTQRQSTKSAFTKGVQTVTDKFNKNNEQNITLNKIQQAQGKDTRGIYLTLKDKLNPLAKQDSDVKQTFVDYFKKRSSNEELANADYSRLTNQFDEALKGVKDKTSLLKAYQKGDRTGVLGTIQQEFDNLFKEANANGLNVQFKKNYLPQVYANSQDDVINATAKYMESKGVDQKTIVDYLSGKLKLDVNISKALKMEPFFSQHAAFPNYATAMQFGLTPKYNNPAQLVAYYRQEMGKVNANHELINNLIQSNKISLDKSYPGMKSVEVPGIGQVYAEPKLQELLSNMFEKGGSAYDKVVSPIANLSKSMQEIKLSAGIPYTDVNFFSTGQLIKEVMSGNLKAIPAFIRANSDSASAKYFAEHAKTIQQMADQGIDMSSRVGSWKTAGENTASILQKAGIQFDKTFSDKTFQSFLPQVQVGLFESAQKRFLKGGMPADVANKMAADVVRNSRGLIGELGRSKSTNDTLSAVFFAPKFREGVINTLANTLKSVTPHGIKDPTLYMNRRLLAGMALTYGLYDALNVKYMGNHMWDNPPGKEGELLIPGKDGKVYRVPFMPSFAAFPRNVYSSVSALAKGDVATATNKAAQNLSMPIKTGAEMLTNKDYYGNQIYTSDSALKNSIDLALYAGNSAMHPYVALPFQIAAGTKTREQALLEAVESPVKVTTQQSLNNSSFSEARAAKQAEDAQTKAAFDPVYNDILQTAKTDKNAAQEMINNLSDEEYKMFENRYNAQARYKQDANVYKTVEQVRELAKTDPNQAQEIINNMSDEEYKVFERVYKTTK